MRQRKRLSESEEHVSHINIDCDSVVSNNPYEEKLDSFPTSGKATLDTDMKEMLKSLRGAIQYDMKAFMQKSKLKMDEVGERVDYIENKITDFTEAHNDHFELEDEPKRLKYKVADLEDRSRRNNIRFCGSPENVKNNDLKQFLQKIILDLILTLPN